MQALSTWSSRNESCLLPQLDIGKLGSSSNLSTKRGRRKRLYLVGSVFHSSKPSCLLVANGLHYLRSRAYFRGQILDFRCESFNEFSIYPISNSKRDSSSETRALACVLEEHAIDSHIVKDNSVSVGKVPEELVEEGVRSLDTDADDDDMKGEVTNNEEKRKRVGKNPRVDIQALGLSFHSARTADDVEELLEDKGALPLQVYSSVIRGLGKDQKLDAAIALYQWLKRKSYDGNNSAIRPNIFIYNSLLGAIKQAEKFDFVDSVLNDMTMDGIPPNIITYNTLMAIYIKHGREVEALSIFEELPKKGLFPTPASYSTAMSAYRSLEDGFGAIKFFVEVKDKYQKGEMGREVDGEWEHEFPKFENFTIRICLWVMRQWLLKNENSCADVLRLLMEMDKAGLQTGRAEYERLVWACTHEKHYAVAKELYSRIRERDTDMSLSVCNHVIWLMGKAKKWWAALEIYEDLLDRGPKPNRMSYELIVSHFSILLTAARKRGIWRWGVRLLNKMEEKGLKPGSKEWNAVLVACSKASETSAAVQIFKRMIEHGEKPSVISYGALLSALEKGKLYDEALKVWKHMVKVGVKPNLYAYTIMASIYTAQGKFNIVNSIIKEMVTVGVEPTVVTFNAIISGCSKNNLGSAAYEWFQRMKSHNITPNEVTYEALIEALASDGKPRLVFELYLRAGNEGLSLSSKAYDSVVHCAQNYGASVDVNALGPRPPEKKKKIHTRKKLSEFCKLADVPRRSKPFDRKEIYTVYSEEGES